MSKKPSWWQPGRSRVLALAALLATGLALGQSLKAAQVIEGKAQWPAQSLKLVPADASFYGSWLRLGERVEAIAKSNAWARIKALPVAQMVWQQAQAAFSEDGFLSGLYNWYQKPENQQLVAMAGDMFSHEVFIYGGPTWPEFARIFQEVYAEAQYGPMIAQLEGKAKDRGQMELQVRAVLKGLARNAKSLRTPDVVIGFRLSKPARAKAQLERLKGLLDKLVEDNAEWKARYKQEKINGGTYLTLRLDGSLVPWDLLPLNNFEDKEGEFEPLIKRLKALKLTLAVGVRENFLLVSIGETTGQLNRLAKGKLLADRKEFRPLAKFNGKRFNSIDFTGEAMSRVAASERMFDTFIGLARQGLAQAPLSRKQKLQINKDLQELSKDLGEFMPKPGPVFSFSFATERGSESYTYDWGQYPYRDGSKPLTLLNHVGGSPLLFLVSRSKTSPEQYQTFVKWVKVGYRYFEEFAVPHIADKETYQKFSKALLPLVKKMSDITEKDLIPALADGQVGFVFDAKLTSKQPLKVMPEADQPLPLPELALVLGVSDPAKLRQAFHDYRQTVNQILAKLHELAPDNVPELKIPPPKTAKVKSGTLYYYPLPEDWGVDPQISPNGGLSDKVAVLSLARKQSARLLADNPLKVKGGPLAKLDRPLSDATYINIAGIIKAVTPWIVYAYQKNVPDEIDQAGGGILSQIRTVLEVLQVFRTYSSVTYQEDGVWVTHGEMWIKDLPGAKGE